MSRLLALLLFALVALSAAAQEETKDAPAEEKLFHPFRYPVGHFNLTDTNGKNFSALDLRGSIWVAHFFYPGCNGTCTRTTPNMKRLQEAFRGKPYVHFLSIALNADTLETLQQFAKDQKADPEQWLFVTASDDKYVHDIVQTCFFNTAYRKKNPTPGDEITHSSRLMLIDPTGLIVGFVDGDLPSAADAMKTEIEKLRLEQPIPVTGANLPWFNAIMNASCTLLLLLGWTAIRLRWVTLHKVLMLLALAASMIFLASYLFYHFVVLGGESMRFRGEGTIRHVYFAILLTHTVLAVVVAPLALFITVQGLNGNLSRHVKVARWTLPMWLYVSVTGVVVYWMLYRLEW